MMHQFTEILEIHNISRIDNPYIMVGIYKITSPSGKVYIGQSWDIDKRKRDHRNDKRKVTFVANSIKKYGFDNHLFEVVHELPTDVSQDVLNTYEQVYIDAYRDCGIELMNLKDAGSNGRLSDELKRKLSDTKQGMGKGRKQSEEWKANRKLFSKGNTVWLGKKHSLETRQKQSLVAIGKKKSPEHAEKNRENFRKATIVRYEGKGVYELQKELAKS